MLEYSRCIMCPLCASPMEQHSGKSLVCKNGHCFDAAKQGYVNFAPNKISAIYPAELFSSRRAVFQAGFYDSIIKRIENIIKSTVASDLPVLLDVGCGEGFYTKNVLRNENCIKFGFDISRDAIKLAAKADAASAYMVADLEHIPMLSSTVDVIIDILTPACYSEFFRVLKKDGIIIKAVPRCEYLRELRSIVGNKLRKQNYDNSDVADYFMKNTRFIKCESIVETHDVDNAAVLSFANMTPMLSGIDIAALTLDKVSTITIALDIFVGGKKDDL